MKNAEERLKKKLCEIVEERFPKGENKERGNATVAMTLLLLASLEEIKRARRGGLTEAIKLLFSKYRKEPMTGNVVILELQGLRGDFNEKELKVNL